MRKALLILFIGAVSLLTCKKDKEEGKEETTSKGSVTVEGSSTTPGDLVTLKFSNILTKESYDILVGDRKVTLAKVSENTGVFMVPFVPAGVKTIDLAAVSTANVEITIGAYTAINDPDAVKTAFLNKLAIAASNLPNGSQKDFLVTAEKTIAEKYSQLSSEEKRNFAFAINKLSLDPPTVEVSSTTHTGLNGAPSNPKEVDAVSIDSEFLFHRETLGCLATTTLGGTLIAGGAILIKVPSMVILDKVVGLAMLATGAKLLYDAFGTAVELAKYKGIAVSLEGLIEIATINRTQIEANRESNAATNTITFKGGRDHNLKFTGTYNNLSKETAIPFFTSFTARMEAAAANYNLIAKTINGIQGFFSSTPALEEIKINIDQKPSSGSANIPASLLTIENISDSQIGLARTGDNNNLSIRATGNNITAEKAFTFDIVYTYNPFNIKLRKTINAIFDGTIEPFKVAVAGGNAQTGESGKQLANALQVLVTDANNQPLADVDVEWKIKNGGGTLTAATGKTNAQGLASTRWTLGSTGNQEVEASVRKKDGSLVNGAPVSFTAITPCSQALAPAITGISFSCNSNGKYGVYVAFTSTGSDLMVGSGSGTCNLETNCYPSRLLIKDTADPNSVFHVASNAYYAKLFSGTLRQGVIEFTFSYTGDCIPGKSAEEAFKYYYSRFLWKVQLMNHCNKRSEEVAF